MQNVLNGKKRITAKYSRTREEFPLRGYLECSCCGKNLTGSPSLGNGGKYFYYHCQKGCKERYLSNTAHEALINWVSDISIKPEIAQLYLAVMKDIFKTNEGDRNLEIKRLEAEYGAKIEMKDKATEKFVKDELDRDTYKRLSEKITNECNETRLRIDELKRAGSGFDDYCQYSISLLSNLPYYYSNASLEGKQKMLGSIFPEKLVFEKGKYRTTKPNEILTLLCNNNADFKENKKGQTANFSDLSLMVTPKGFEPISSEPESEILSIELQGHVCKIRYSKIDFLNHQN